MPKIMKSMNSISRCQSIYRQEHSPKELLPCYHTFILAICREPGRSQEELAKDICLNKSTVARTLTQLENMGYVTRTPNPKDKRQLLVYPTEQMTKVLPTVRKITATWNELIAADISDKEMEIFESVLRRMEASARALISEGEDK